MLRKPAAAPGMPGGHGSVAGLVLSAAMVLTLASPLAAQFSAAPVILDLVTGDSAAVGRIQVKNQGDGPLRLRFYAGDFEQTPEGKHRFMAAGTDEHSCAGRMQLYPEGTTLRVGGSVTVTVRLDPAPTACWSVVFAESGKRAADGITVAQRIAVKVYGSSRTGVRSGEVAAVEVLKTPSLHAKVDFSNTGDRALVVKGHLEVRTVAGEVVATAPVVDFSVLPGRHRVIDVAMPKDLKAGRYLAIPILDFGGDFLAAGQALFEVPDP
ncbi:MAG: hypothetical protein P8Z36_04495 [Gemmatimonadota bacterium]